MKHAVEQDTVHAQALWRRAARCARRGEFRKAAVAMREAVAIDPTPASYTRLGCMLEKAGRRNEAVDALKQALFLFRQADLTGRARTVARMILALDPHDRSASRAAA